VQPSPQLPPGGFVILVMGVAGSGKTTIGRALAAATEARFIDADDYHSPANVQKMSRGEALTDGDRAPWLAALRQVIAGVLHEGGRAVLACSALKQAYRDVLRVDEARVPLVYLRGSRALIAQRLSERQGHYASGSLLDSQLATLEAPAGALEVDVAAAPAAIVRDVLQRLGFAARP